jgi:hypothetical protein
MPEGGQQVIRVANTIVNRYGHKYRARLPAARLTASGATRHEAVRNLEDLASQVGSDRWKCLAFKSVSLHGMLLSSLSAPVSIAKVVL